MAARALACGLALRAQPGVVLLVPAALHPAVEVDDVEAELVVHHGLGPRDRRAGGKRSGGDSAEPEQQDGPTLVAKAHDFLRFLESSLARDVWVNPREAGTKRGQVLFREKVPVPFSLSGLSLEQRIQ
jgi:hypothetical protein